VALIFVGGGARSGKSRFALELARKFAVPSSSSSRVAGGASIAFIATAEAFDDEMRDRIARHRKERGPEFETIEAPYELASALSTVVTPVAIVDCLTLWCSNLMLADRDIAAETEHVLVAARSIAATVIFVSNEVGQGIVPENALARRFRDEAGRLNQRIAAAADEVYLMAFGIPVKIK
jgi:adenosylcobinamide kinase/adenosylcobinamide-phosphate guanylyltransferase